MNIIGGIFFVSVVGTLLHFLYDISGHNKVVGLFASVNESTWEHIKIALTPTFLWSLYDGYIYGSNSNYFFAKVVSILMLIVVIPLLFYGYKVIFKRNVLFIDISIFYIAIIFSQVMFGVLINAGDVGYLFNYVSLVVLFVIFGFYMVVTLFPLKNLFFKDPITKKYGVKGHRWLWMRFLK